MPFTPTHVLAIVPVAAIFRWLPLSALAIGSMMPDAPMFVPLFTYGVTHSTTGVFLVCMPLGMAAFMVFQCLLKRPLMALLPAWTQSRLTAVSRPLLLPSIPFFLSVAAALVIGAYSHLVWDAFTHEGRWGVQLVPALQKQYEIAGWSLPGFKIFQYGSTIIGLPLLVVCAAAKLIRTRPEIPNDILPFSAMAKLTAFFTALLIPILSAAIEWQRSATPSEVLGATIKSTGTALMTAAICYSLVFQWLDPRGLKGNAVKHLFPCKTGVCRFRRI